MVVVTNGQATFGIAQFVNVVDSVEGSVPNGIYTITSGSFKQYSTWPYTSNPETATNEMLNSGKPGIYIFPLFAGKLNCAHHIINHFLITLSLDFQATKVCKCKLHGLACESMRMKGETVPASCN